ncbi:MAG: hypothetical protein KatS3mg068_1988 [Candidatus Sericytochromatia bacterium]|nr:MAG: hypothetical protein KatS3mg068_1988 [Candidatus Sericytochromatia bacterium]
MISNLTIAFIVDNIVREKLLLKNPVFNNNQINKKIFFIDNYEPSYYKNEYFKYSKK